MHYGLAEKNGLTVGDSVTFLSSGGQEVQATICSLYQAVDGNGAQGAVISTPYRSENQIYTGHRLLEALGVFGGHEQVTVYLQNPEQAQ